MSSLTVVVVRLADVPADQTDGLGVGVGLLQVLEQAGHRVVRRDRPRAPEVRLCLTEDARAAAAVEREHLVLGRRGQHGAEVVDVRRELGTHALRDQLGHCCDACRRVAGLVIEDGVVELRSAGGLDVLGGQFEATGHRLAVERTRPGQGQHGAELDGLARARCRCVDAQHRGDLGSDVTAPARVRRCRRNRPVPAGRCGGAVTALVVVIATHAAKNAVAPSGTDRSQQNRPAT